MKVIMMLTVTHRSWWAETAVPISLRPPDVAEPLAVIHVTVATMLLLKM